jgi:hypothetical protein
MLGENNEKEGKDMKTEKMVKNTHFGAKERKEKKGEEEFKAKAEGSD